MADLKWDYMTREELSHLLDDTLNLLAAERLICQELRQMNETLTRIGHQQAAFANAERAKLLEARQQILRLQERITELDTLLERKPATSTP